MEYTATKLKESISIEELYTIHYFEYDKNFVFSPESHDFWEMQLVDNGKALVKVNDLEIKLSKNEVIFHEPNEKHDVRATENSHLDLIVISFKTTSVDMNFFAHKILTLDDEERKIINVIIIEARKLFKAGISDPYSKKMVLVDNPPFGSEQIIKINIEMLLIHLIRRYKANSKPKTISKFNDNQMTAKKIASYLKANLANKITIQSICRDNFINKDKLQKIFKSEFNMTVNEYLTHIKISEAKRLIRTGIMNFTQISNILGYQSIHYFSNQFKKVTSLSPSEYASSIKALSDNE